MSAASIGTKEKQSGETKDYPVSYARWFSNRTDAPLSVAVSTVGVNPVVGDPGLTVSADLVEDVVRVVASGGVHGRKYKVTILLTTDASGTPIVEEADFFIKIKDV